MLQAFLSLHACKNTIYQFHEIDCATVSQKLAKLLHQPKAGGHKALFFTRMTKMLDVLEVFLNLHASNTITD